MVAGSLGCGVIAQQPLKCTFNLINPNLRQQLRLASLCDEITACMRCSYDYHVYCHFCWICRELVILRLYPCSAPLHEANNCHLCVVPLREVRTFVEIKLNHVFERQDCRPTGDGHKTDLRLQRDVSRQPMFLQVRSCRRFNLQRPYTIGIAISG
jgi:hypothetical protein